MQQAFISWARPLFYTQEDSLRWGWQLLFFMPIVGISTVLVDGPPFWMASQLGWMPPMGQPIEGLAWSAIVPLIIFRYLFMFAGLLTGVHLAQRWLRKDSLAGLGFRLAPGWGRELFLGCGLGVVMMAVSVGLSWLMGWYRPFGFAWEYHPWSLLLPSLVRSALPNIQAGLLEEVIFRGFLFQVLEERWNTRIAVITSSVLFAYLHLANAQQDYPTWMVLLSITVAGLSFSQAYLATRNLWLAIGLHFAYDWLITLVGEVGRGVQDAVLVATEVTGPPLFVGPQNAGVGIFDMAGLAVVAVIVYTVWMRGKGTVNESGRS